MLLLCFLGLALVSSSTSDTTGTLLGTWTNDKNSTLWIEAAADGALSGWYASAVGHAAGKYAVSGVYDVGSNTLGFAVAWSNAQEQAPSVTAWSGQRFGDTLLTMWTLGTSVASPSEFWDSTLVGQDVFQRA